jgi:hypothetical protein
MLFVYRRIVYLQIITRKATYEWFTKQKTPFKNIVHEGSSIFLKIGYQSKEIGGSATARHQQQLVGGAMAVAASAAVVAARQRDVGGGGSATARRRR